MNDREKLIDLIIDAKRRDPETGSFTEFLADNLIANGVTVQQWVPVRERFPSENEYCIVHYVHTYCDNDGYWEIGTSFFNGNQFQIWPAYKVTHWMPMPYLPMEEEK